MIEDDFQILCELQSNDLRWFILSFFISLVSFPLNMPNESLDRLVNVSIPSITSPNRTSPVATNVNRITCHVTKPTSDFNVFIVKEKMGSCFILGIALYTLKTITTKKKNRVFPTNLWFYMTFYLNFFKRQNLRAKFLWF